MHLSLPAYLEHRLKICAATIREERLAKAELPIFVEHANLEAGQAIFASLLEQQLEMVAVADEHTEDTRKRTYYRISAIVG